MRLFDLCAAAVLLWMLFAMAVVEFVAATPRPLCTRNSIAAIFAGCVVIR